MPLAASTLNGLFSSDVNPQYVALALSGRAAPRCGKEKAGGGAFCRPPDLVNGKMLTAMGRELAAIHLGTANPRKAITADLEGRKRGWLLAAVTTASGRLREEQAEWRAAFR